MTDILGISAFYHDSAACLVRDGKIVAAAQELGALFQGAHLRPDDLLSLHEIISLGRTALGGEPLRVPAAAGTER